MWMIRAGALPISSRPCRAGNSGQYRALDNFATMCRAETLAPLDHALALGVGLQRVVDVEHRLAEELVAALLLDAEQAAPVLTLPGRRRSTS
jgi:hypothetical protein